MELLGQVAIAVAVLVIIFSVLFLIFTHTATQKQLTAAQATQLVINDLKTENPTANITVINVSNSTLQKGSYNIVFAIVYNNTRACPTLFIEGFDYPATGLSPSVDNLYTRGNSTSCIINGLTSTAFSNYLISTPQVATAISYNQSIPQVKDYVNLYGYNNTDVNAKLYQNLSGTYTGLPQNYYNVWLVRYNATGADYSYYEVVGSGSTGSVVANYTAKS
jgi:hypothetical protein